MKQISNDLLDRFINLIGDLEKVPRDRMYKVRIKKKILKLRRGYLKILKNKNIIDIPYLLNFTAFLNTISGMKIINNIDIETEDIEVSTKIYKIDISIYGIFIHMRVFDNKTLISIFDLKTKMNKANDAYMDITIESFKPSSLEEKDYITSVHLDSITSLSNKNNDGDLKKNSYLDAAFVILKDIFTMYYNHIFDELERKYLNEK